MGLIGTEELRPLASRMRTPILTHIGVPDVALLSVCLGVSVALPHLLKRGIRLTIPRFLTMQADIRESGEAAGKKSQGTYSEHWSRHGRQHFSLPCCQYDHPVPPLGNAVGPRWQYIYAGLVPQRWPLQ